MELHTAREAQSGAAGGHGARLRFSPQSQTQTFAALDFVTTVDVRLRRRCALSCTLEGIRCGKMSHNALACCRLRHLVFILSVVFNPFLTCHCLCSFRCCARSCTQGGRRCGKTWPSAWACCCRRRRRFPASTSCRCGNQPGVQPESTKCVLAGGRAVSAGGVFRQALRAGASLWKRISSTTEVFRKAKHCLACGHAAVGAGGLLGRALHASATTALKLQCAERNSSIICCCAPCCQRRQRFSGEHFMQVRKIRE